LIPDAPLPLLPGFINLHGGTHLFYVSYAASTPWCADSFFDVLVPAGSGSTIVSCLPLCSFELWEIGLSVIAVLLLDFLS
jgi:hypothetical protein